MNECFRDGTSYWIIFGRPIEPGSDILLFLVEKDKKLGSLNG